MNKIFENEAWEDYLNWADKNEEILKKINDLILEIDEGTANPKRLKKRFAGAWSQQIDEENQLVYKIDKKRGIFILACKGNYE